MTYLPALAITKVQRRSQPLVASNPLNRTSDALIHWHTKLHAGEDFLIRSALRALSFTAAAGEFSLRRLINSA